MHSSDDVHRLLGARLGELTLPFAGDLIRAAIARAIKQASIYRILELRQRIRAEFDQDEPAVRETLELIDGQIVLREIAGTKAWR